MSIESELYDHFNTQKAGNSDLNSLTILWISQNISASVSPSTEYIVPNIVLGTSGARELPYDQSIVRYDYIFFMNLLLKENTGTSKVYTMADAIRSIYHKKTITTSSYTYSFDTLEVSNGFMTGGHFEVPVTINFYTFAS